MSHHEKAPFVTAALLVVVIVLTGVAAFTDYWGVEVTNSKQYAHTGIYNWGKSDANSMFKKSPGWVQCVVVTQLMAFSFELLFLLLLIPAIIFRKKMPVHAACTLIALIIFILLTISVITWAVNVNNYRLLVVKIKVGWSWGLALAADILSLILFLVAGSATGYATYTEYR